MAGGARKGSNWCGGGRGFRAGCWCASARLKRTFANIHHWCSWRLTKCHTFAYVGVWGGDCAAPASCALLNPALLIDTLV